MNSTATENAIIFLNKTVRRLIHLLALGRETRLPLLMKNYSRQIVNKLPAYCFTFSFKCLVELQFLKIFSLCVLFIKLLFNMNNFGVTSCDLCLLSAVLAISVHFRYGTVVFAIFYFGFGAFNGSTIIFFTLNSTTNNISFFFLKLPRRDFIVKPAGGRSHVPNLNCVPFCWKYCTAGVRHGN